MTTPMRIVIVFEDDKSGCPDMAVIHDYVDYDKEETQNVRGYSEAGRIFQELADYCLHHVVPKGTA